MSSIKKKFLLTLAFAAALNIFLLGIFFWLQVFYISPYATELLETQQYIDNIDQDVQNYKRVVAPRLAAERKYIEEVRSLFYQDDPLDLIVYFQDAMKRNSLVEQSIAPPSGQGEKLVTIGVSGDYADILHFLREIESGKFLLSINSLSLANRAATIQFALQSP